MDCRVASLLAMTRLLSSLRGAAGDEAIHLAAAMDCRVALLLAMTRLVKWAHAPSALHCEKPQATKQSI
jgi:hypothetical protein